MVLVAGALLAAGLGWLLARMLVAMLTHVFDPPPDHLAIPWGFLALLYGGRPAGGGRRFGHRQPGDRPAAARPHPARAMSDERRILETMLPRVLVIEDDGDLRRLLRRGLEEEGFEVVQASLGKDAVALAEAGSARTCWSSTSACRTPTAATSARRSAPAASSPRSSS